MIITKRRQHSENDEWLKLWEVCLDIVPEERIEALTKEAIYKARLISNKYRNVAYGWSGGKDSIALVDILLKSGIQLNGCLCVLHQNEYPAFEQWLIDNQPPNTTFLRSDKHSIDFLNKNPEYLFPHDRKARYEYTSDWRQMQKYYIRKNGIDLFFAGRRTKDGNVCGKQDEDGIHLLKNKDCTECNLIAGWTNEELVAYIKHNKLELPPIYFWKKGWRFGTHPWTERGRGNAGAGTIEDAFDEVWEIDSSVVIKAAKDGLIEAQKYLSKKGVY